MTENPSRTHPEQANTRIPSARSGFSDAHASARGAFAALQDKVMDC